LVNYDREYEDIRRYHLKSIVDVEVLDESFTITSEIAEILERFKYAINAYFEPLVEPYAVELYIDAKVAKYFERMPLNSRQRVMQRYDVGSIDLEIYITDDMEIIPTVQRYMPYVRVIEPEGLRDKFS
jgi:predicted DNA-binding transcriptional regulator YafY